MSRSESMGRSGVAGYSSEVQLLLVASGRAYPLAQIGPDSVTLRHAVELPPGEAEVVMRIDARERRWSVMLSHGAVPFDTEVATVDI